jgi:hypothetical protein
LHLVRLKQLLGQILLALIQLLLTIVDDEIALLDCVVIMSGIKVKMRAAL